MTSEVIKGLPLTKEETKALLDLIESSNYICNKTTNACNNKLKNVEWVTIADKFNATVAIFKRSPQQLRLKWENLKKNARKRVTKIRMNHLKTGGGLPKYIPPDEILDRVTSLLGSTATGLRVQFGGDREEDEERVQSPNFLGDDCIIEELPGPIQRIKEPIPNKGSPRKRQLEKKLKIGRVELIKERDQAITDYYKRKKDLLDGKIENINLQNEKLKLENEKIKLENEKLKLELEKVK